MVELLWGVRALVSIGVIYAGASVLRSQKDLLGVLAKGAGKWSFRSAAWIWRKIPGLPLLPGCPHRYRRTWHWEHRFDPRLPSPFAHPMREEKRTMGHREYARSLRAMPALEIGGSGKGLEMKLPRGLAPSRYRRRRTR